MRGLTIHSYLVAKSPYLRNNHLETNGTYVGYIQESGAIVLSTVDDPDHTNFTYMADQVNCTDGDQYEILSCMQQTPAQDLIAVYNSYNSTLNGGKTLNFNPQSDNETSFGNYSERGLLGRVAKVVRDEHGSPI